MQQWTRRDLLSCAGKAGLALIAGGSGLGPVEIYEKFSSRARASSKSVPQGQRRAAVLVFKRDEPHGLKHIVFDDRRMVTPMCFLHSGIEGVLEKYEGGAEWRPLILEDHAFYEALGDIPTEGKPLPRECYLIGATWIAHALHTHWPHKAPINDSLTYLGKTESHEILQFQELQMDFRMAVPLVG